MSCADGPNFCIFRANTFNSTQTVKDCDGTAIDITNYTIKFTLKKDTYSSETILVKSLTISDGPNGIAILQLTKTETDIDPMYYWYDMEFESGDSSIVKAYRGRFEVKE